MSRNDKILLAFFSVLIASVVLIAFAPAEQHSIAANLWALVNSPIIIATVSTLAAAFAGTWGAQKLAERKADRKEALSEIRSVNLAIGLAFAITNTYIGMKKQHVRPLLLQYRTLVYAYQRHLDSMRSGLSDNTFQFSADLKSLAVPFSPVSELRHIMRERMSSDNTTLMMLTPLTQSVEGFADTVSELNGIQSDFRSRMDQRQRQALFFGTEFEPGRIDNRFSDCLNALEMQTDDCIAFSILIGNRLADLGQKLAASYGKSAPGVVKASFEKAKDYIPEMSPYAAWVNTT